MGSKLRHSRVERIRPAAEDEDEGALLDEAFCSGEADAGGATGDHGGLSIQSGHIVQSLFRCLGFWRKEGPPGPRTWGCRSHAVSMKSRTSVVRKRSSRTAERQIGRASCRERVWQYG